MGDRPSERKWTEWIEARRRHHLTDAQLQMARELGMKPDSFRKLDNHRQEPWKLPLREFIEEQYRVRFARDTPQVVLSIEECMRRDVANREAKRARKAERRAGSKGASSQLAVTLRPCDRNSGLALELDAVALKP